MKNLIITAAVALLLGLGLGSQLLPKVKIETKEVEKEVRVKDVVTVTKIITKPDGTKEEVITVIDKTKENLSKVSTQKVMAKDWHASVAVKTDNIRFEKLTYGVSVERRVLGDIFLGVNADTEGKFGGSVGIEF